MGAFLSGMDKEKEEILSMDPLHAQAHLVVCKLRKLHLERELIQYQKVIAFATPEMSAFETLLNQIEEIFEQIKAYEQEIKNIIEWRR